MLVNLLTMKIYPQITLFFWMSKIFAISLVIIEYLKYKQIKGFPFWYLIIKWFENLRI